MQFEELKGCFYHLSLFILVVVAAHSNSSMQAITAPVLGDKFSFQYVSPHLLFINN